MCLPTDGSSVPTGQPGDPGQHRSLPARARLATVEWEPPDVVGRPVWLYPQGRWGDEQFKLGPEHDALRDAIGNELDQLRSKL